MSAWWLLAAFAAGGVVAVIAVYALIKSAFGGLSLWR